MQCQLEGRSWRDIDWRRNLVFVAFGFAYLGVAQWFIYVEGFRRLFPAMDRFCDLPLRAKLRDGPGLRALLAQIGLDFVVIQPFMYWPSYYSCCMRAPQT